ncbi:hypothetical protein GXM_01320 [Nostoc sphaeroides CCNUC1]|uniref:Uncharacterized protein n=1 Tax=Nostoc sphaeroides CCNUC1 TaxID=2653204 RepID=A0A5P8VTY8_9NOSO|nr:hypothetical protein GXM_01320 [Nostoc sphaeroides CCNUC1]
MKWYERLVSISAYLGFGSIEQSRNAWYKSLDAAGWNYAEVSKLASLL